MSHQSRFTQEKLEKKLQLLRSYRFSKAIPLTQMTCQLLDGPATELKEHLFSKTAKSYSVQPGDYWLGQGEDFLLQFGIDTQGIAADCMGLYLRLGTMGDIFNHPEALVRINGEIVGSTDRHHHLLNVPQHLADSEFLEVSLQGWSGLTGWPIEGNNPSRLQMGNCSLVQSNAAVESLIILLDSALQTTRYLQDDHPSTDQLLDALDGSILHLDSSIPGSQDWIESAELAVATLQNALLDAGNPLDVHLHAIGHAHIDIAYLWTVSQARLKVARTFSNQLSLMSRYPQYRFSQSQPALCDMLADDYPDLYGQLKQRVQQGRWEILGGMWVEADVNLPGPESLVRQFLLSRAWCDDELDSADTRVLWLPDTFGFPWCLPQLMHQAGIEYFITSKLNWNQYNQIPASTHRWRGIDGTEVIAHVLTTPRPVEHLPFPTNYKSDLSANEIAGTWTEARSPGVLRDFPICYGFGDGGGGPTDALVRTVDVYAHMPAMPTLAFSTVQAYLDSIRHHTDKLPVWDDEHYLEGHRGTYTSQGWIKRANRQAEHRLQTVEALAVMLGQSVDTGSAWKLLCLNQFHDILPGTAIAAVMKQARADFARLNETIDHLMTELSGDNELSSRSSMLVSTLPYATHRLIELEQSEVEAQSIDVSQIQKLPDDRIAMLVHCEPYSLRKLDHLAIVNKDLYEPLHVSKNESAISVETQWLQITINSAGQITSLIDKALAREMIDANLPANQWQIFEDRPLVWEAWDIEPYFEDHKTTLDDHCQLDMGSHGPWVAQINTKRHFRSSVITQSIRIYRHTPRIDFTTQVNWQEPNQLLKVSFPVAIRSRRALYDIQWGYIDRPTHRNTSWDQARFEVPAQKWACLRDESASVAILNDCKYGYDVADNQIRLTLIKSSSFPDPTADLGDHEFTYSLLTTSQPALHTINREAWELNSPLLVQPVPELPGIVFDEAFVSCSNPNVEIQTIKPAADGNGYIVRLYENSGSPCIAHLHYADPPKSIEQCNILEQTQHSIKISHQTAEIELKPFEIASFRCLPA